MGRLLIVEREQALAWGVDPRVITKTDPTAASNEPTIASQHSDQIESPQHVQTVEKNDTPIPSVSEKDVESLSAKNISLLSLILQLSKSPRALVALFIIFVYGCVFPRVISLSAR